MNTAAAKCMQCGATNQHMARFCPRCSAPFTPMPRLNLLAFPYDTNNRFILLVVAIIGTSAYIYASLLNTLLVQWPSAGSAAYFALAMLIGVMLPLIVATILLWLYPHVLIYMNRMRPLSRDELTSIKTKLDAALVGFKRLPVFLTQSNDLKATGLAFGRPGRMYVYLSKGLIAKASQEPDTFEAVLLHELAHVRNGDVSKTYFTRASLYAFLGTSILPLVCVVYTSLSSSLLVIGSTILLGMIVCFIRMSVLRAREYYADLSASQYQPAIAGLRDQLSKEMQVWKEKHEHFWQTYLDNHPDPQKRLDRLDDPTPLFHMGFSEALATGIMTTAALFSLIFLAGVIFLSTGLELSVLVFLAVALTLAPLAVIVVSIGIWRMSFVALMHRVRIRGAGTLGIGLGLGMVIGILVSLCNPLRSRFAGVLTFSSLLIWLVLLVVILLLLGGFCRWMATGAQSWLAISLNRSSPRPFYWFGLTLAGTAGLAIFVFFLLAFGVGLMSQSGSFTLVQTLRFLPWVALVGPLTTLTLFSLWAYPLFPAFLPRRQTGYRWVFLDTWVPDGIRLPSALPLHPGRAMVIGLGCGLVGLGLLLLVHSLLRLEGIAFIYAIMACTLAMQIDAAVCGPRAARNLAWLHGLCAAQIAGIICVLAFPIWLSSIPWFIPVATLNGGTIIAALVAALSAFLARAVRSI